MIEFDHGKWMIAYIDYPCWTMRKRDWNVAIVKLSEGQYAFIDDFDRRECAHRAETLKQAKLMYMMLFPDGRNPNA